MAIFTKGSSFLLSFVPLAFSSSAHYTFTRMNFNDILLDGLRIESF